LVSGRYHSGAETNLGPTLFKNFKDMQTFLEKVKRIVIKIPRGKTLTYAEVAQRAGSPRAQRAVGSVLNKNRDPKVPCHRVIRSDGTLGGYNRGAKKKKQILRSEGAII
jgi:O-6-methylguanine DNA methyltransferase